MTATISRLYNNYADARDAVRNLEAAGVAHNDINIIASNADNWYSSDRKPGKDTFPDRDLDGKDDRAEAAGTGAGVGAAVGGTAGLLAGLGLMAIPGVGALTQAGVSKEDADIYAEGLRRGGAVVSARVPDADATRLQAIMDRSAVNVRERAVVYRQGGWQAFNVKETPYTADQVRKERELYMQR
jgi:hypothetical protein